MDVDLKQLIDFYDTHRNTVRNYFSIYTNCYSQSTIKIVDESGTVLASNTLKKTSTDADANYSQTINLSNITGNVKIVRTFTTDDWGTYSGYPKNSAGLKSAYLAT